MFKLVIIKEERLVQHCDQCDANHNNYPNNPWCGFSGHFGMVENSYNLHFHFCQQECMAKFKEDHGRM